MMILSIVQFTFFVAAEVSVKFPIMRMQLPIPNQKMF